MIDPTFATIVGQRKEAFRNGSPIFSILTFLKITLPDISQEAVYTEIFDINGKLIYKSEIQVYNSKSINVPFSSFSKGLYFVKLSLNEPKTIKIIKK